jgi:hypothetical protein
MRTIARCFDLAMKGAQSFDDFDGGRQLRGGHLGAKRLGGPT